MIYRKKKREKEGLEGEIETQLSMNYLIQVKRTLDFYSKKIYTSDINNFVFKIKSLYKSEGFLVKDSEILAYFLENLWTKGFKLTDEEVNFIYFGQKYTNTSIEHVKLALSFTLQLQMSFDRSFYISLLELFSRHDIQNKKEAIFFLKQNGLMK